MKVKAQIQINAPKEVIWDVITDIENSDKNISGIKKIEILERPESGNIGLKWRESREMFGKEATEDMWITEEQVNSYYQTRAESHGSVYVSRLSIDEKGDHCILTMEFTGESTTFGAKVGNFIFSGMLKKSTEKALFVDLEDIKKVAESKVQ